MQKTPYVFPIIGGRKVEQLEANLEALKIALSEEQVKYLESIVPIDLGFPYFITVSIQNICTNVPETYHFPYQGDGSEYSALTKSAGHFVKWPVTQAIRPSS